MGQYRTPRRRDQAEPTKILADRPRAGRPATRVGPGAPRRYRRAVPAGVGAPDRESRPRRLLTGIRAPGNSATGHLAVVALHSARPRAGRPGMALPRPLVGPGTDTSRRSGARSSGSSGSRSVGSGCRRPTATSWISTGWTATGSTPNAETASSCSTASRGRPALTTSSGLLRVGLAAGWHPVVFNFRSCSGELNSLPRFYHSGETGDLAWVVQALVARAPGVAVGAVGVSLGGNVLLKWLGEVGEEAPAELRGAVGISVPFDVAASARVLDRGFHRLVYAANFLRTMRSKVIEKERRYPGFVDVAAMRRARTFARYDRVVTAPLNGFRDEVDYWTRASSGPYLAADPPAGAPPQRPGRPHRARAHPAGSAGAPGERPRRVHRARRSRRVPRGPVALAGGVVGGATGHGVPDFPAARLTGACYDDAGARSWAPRRPPCRRDTAP